MLAEYLAAARPQTHDEILLEDGSFSGEIPPCPSVHANADPLETCREELAEVLKEWILQQTHRQLPFPTIGGHELLVKDRA